MTIKSYPLFRFYTIIHQNITPLHFSIAYYFKKVCIKFGRLKNNTYLCTRKINAVGAIAQLVEQRTENPCVPGSIPGGTTPPFI